VTEHLLPISKTNVVTLINCETTYATAPTTASSYKHLAFNASSIVRQQTLVANPELRGSRMQGALVFGPKNPSGPMQGYQNDQTIVMFYEALFGSRTTTEVAAAGLTVTAAVGATTGSTFPDAGLHTYALVASKGGTGTTKRTLHSALNVVGATVTPDGSHQVNVTLVGGPLPVGWTWALYRTKVWDSVDGHAGDPKVVGNYFEVVPALALAAGVSVYADDQADSALTTAMPTASDTGYGDYKHVITVGNTLPSYAIERSVPYPLDAYDYTLAVGCKVDTGKVQFKSTGYFDLQTAWLAQSVVTGAVSAETGTAKDWRNGEKLHQAMIGSGKVKVGPALSGLSGLAVFGKFMDLSIDHNNNLDKTDYPLGLAGDRGSLAELQAITQVSGTVKVSDPSVLALIQSAPALNIVSIEHDFATFGHSMIERFYGCQFDPSDAAVSGQGILTIPFMAHAVQDPTSGLQAEIIIVNGEPAASYNPVA
jgi:hypothetical protein